MLKLVSFFESIPTTLWIGLAFILVLCGTFFYGEHRIQSKWDADIAARAKTISEVKVAQSDVSKQVGTQYVNIIHQVMVKGDAIEKKVPVYVPIQADSQCVIPNGFVSVWNAANSGGTLPDVPDSTMSEASGVKLSDVATEHTAEATYTRQLETQVNNLIDWIDGQSKVTKEVK